MENKKVDKKNLPYIQQEKEEKVNKSNQEDRIEKARIKPSFNLTRARTKQLRGVEAKRIIKRKAEEAKPVPLEINIEKILNLFEELSRFSTNASPSYFVSNLISSVYSTFLRYRVNEDVEVVKQKIRDLLCKVTDPKLQKELSKFLTISATSGHINAVELLLEPSWIRLDIENTPVMGPPLMAALANGFYDTAYLLLDKAGDKINLNHISKTFGNSAIHLIIAKGERNAKNSNNPQKKQPIDIVKKLVELGADINLNVLPKKINRDFTNTFKKASLPIIIALLRRDREIVNYLLDKGAEIPKFSAIMTKLRYTDERAYLQCYGLLKGVGGVIKLDKQQWLDENNRLALLELITKK